MGACCLPFRALNTPPTPHGPPRLSEDVLGETSYFKEEARPRKFGKSGPKRGRREIRCLKETPEHMKSAYAFASTAQDVAAA